jgi:hypothetical protein
MVSGSLFARLAGFVEKWLVCLDWWLVECDLVRPERTMNRTIIVWITLLGLGLAPASARSQFVSRPDNPFNPTIGGVPVSCTSLAGKAVAFIPNANLRDVGRARPGFPPTIELNPTLLRQLPGKMQLFWYGHECAHHVLSLNTEPRADCWSIQNGKMQGLFSRTDVLEMQQYLLGLPGSPWGHLPGEERAKLLLACFEAAPSPAPAQAPTAKASQAEDAAHADEPASETEAAVSSSAPNFPSFVLSSPRPELFDFEINGVLKAVATVTYGYNSVSSAEGELSIALALPTSDGGLKNIRIQPIAFVLRDPQRLPSGAYKFVGFKRGLGQPVMITTRQVPGRTSLRVSRIDLPRYGGASTPAALRPLSAAGRAILEKHLPNADLGDAAQP